MNYELAKELKDAGFPQECFNGDMFYSPGGDPSHISALRPSLEHLIDACIGLHPEWWFECERNGISGKWLARLAKYPSSNSQFSVEKNEVYLKIEDTLEDAVATLYLSLLALQNK